MYRTHEDDDETIIRDGESVYVPMVLMDEMQRKARDVLRRETSPQARVVDAFGRPAGFARGYCFDTDPTAAAAREQAQHEYEDRLTSAWRGTHAPQQAARVSGSSEEAHKAYEDWLTNAWRTPHGR